MTNKSVEETKEELVELIANQVNYEKEITINEEQSNNIVQIAIGMYREYNDGIVSLITINGIQLEIEISYFQNPKYLANYIDNLLLKSGVEINKAKLIIYKYDYFEGMYKLIPTFNTDIDYKKSMRKLIDPSTLEINKSQLVLHYMDINFDQYENSLSGNFIAEYRRSIREGYVTFGHLDLTEEDDNFLKMCWNLTNNTEVLNYSYEDRYLGTVVIDKNNKSYKTICYRKGYTFIKCFEVYFKIFDLEVYKNASLSF